MLTELNQLLACRREREDRAAEALRRAHAHHAALKQALGNAEGALNAHQDEIAARQSKLYKRSLRKSLTVYEIDSLNIELDLMGEETEALSTNVEEARANLAEAAEAVEKASAVYRKHRQARDRWKHLVDDVEENEQRDRDQAEEFAVEDDIGDRQAGSAGPAWS